MQAEITAAGLKAPTADTELRNALQPLKGVHMISLRGDKLVVCYDPLFTTAEELGAAVNTAGYAVREVTTARDSLMAN